MLWYNIINIKSFYESYLGISVSKAINRAINKLWANAEGENIIAVGYAFPYLQQYKNNQDNNITVVMPPETGIMHWPNSGYNRVVSASEYELPIASNSVNRVIAVHALEYTDHAKQMLTDIHRILTPSGRAIIAVPHRMGIWSQRSHTPFGGGHPFSYPQLSQLMIESQLIPIRYRQALYFPPYNSRAVNTIARLWESCLPILGGVLIIEVEKQIYATAGNIRKCKKRELYIPPITNPVLPKDLY
jgi:SAM-dependent methyltransferase